MKNKKQTLVILTPGFPKDELDTTCLPPQQVFVKALKAVCPGLNIIVLTFQYPFYEAEYHWHGVRVISIGGKGKGQLRRVMTWYKAWKNVENLNSQYHIIGLLSFWMNECAFIGSRFAKKYGLTHYCWLLGQDAKKGNKYFRWIKPKGDELIALSDFIVREVEKNYGLTPFQVIPVGIDTSTFNKAPLKRNIDILGAGSLIPLKRYDLFVEAVAYLKQFYPDINTVICGKGPDADLLRSAVKAKELEQNITLAGELPHEKVFELMQRSRVFLHPSEYEGFGSILSEALYSGAHVVSFVKPMNKDYRNHYVVEDIGDMKNMLLDILNSKTEHVPVLMCTAEQTAKDMISLFVN